MVFRTGVYHHGSPGSQPRKEVGAGGERLGVLGRILGMSSGRGVGGGRNRAGVHLIRPSGALKLGDPLEQHRGRGGQNLIPQASLALEWPLEAGVLWRCPVRG